MRHTFHKISQPDLPIRLDSLLGATVPTERAVECSLKPSTFHHSSEVSVQRKEPKGLALGGFESLWGLRGKRGHIDW
ncbi:hypothetical protein CC1G_14372 [Coprinopsis cinerea okayama7|uniref:Uncharacterized protein n=1 Tax=Coprinopsis cinerea (strain Okayama-7 / 130 / ATCC MYA-4618 / FGSC 9003) TaxID=240176 RepID=D6RM83_COPC7|nr:hypothetical protein CC1G_14372 [Coprinopsis cinerea okayama7\|eukprot:XP_002911375.1 hypothetical protein CC1G_14372 [Coprinopsis cinerea okayama7\